MAINTKSKVIAAKIETVFNVAEVLASTDTFTVKSNSKVDATLDTVARDIIQDSMLKTAPIPVRENTSGTIDFELMPSGTVDDLLGDPFLEAGMGRKSIAAIAGAGTGCFIGYSDDGVTIADQIYMAQATDVNASTAVAYTLANTTEATKSLTIKEFLGLNKSVEATGNVIDSIDIALPTADVATISYSFAGCGFTTNNADTKLTPSCTSTIPYLGKSATFTFDGGSLPATDVSIKIANTVYNEESLIANGYTSKKVTSKDITGSFTLLFEDYTLLTKLQNNTDGTLYIVLTQGINKFAVYIPALKLTTFSKADSSGIMTQTVEFTVVNSCVAGQEAIIIGQEVV